jgi:prephenate dehydrogenase
MSSKNLSIIGLGLIGGSVALGLRSAGAPWRITAYDTTSEELDLAVEAGAIDHAAPSMEEAVAGADLIILAVPVLAIVPLGLKIMEIAPAGAAVTDVGSTKESIVSAMEVAPSSEASFVGGHPIAGTEDSGFAAAREDLFSGAPYITTPTSRTREEAAEAVTGLWASLGSRIYRMSPEEHDRLFALISHLPHLAAFGLVGTVLSQLDPEEVERFTGGGFRDFTRIAASDPVMWRDICLDNQRHILRTLDHLLNELSFIRETLAEGDGEALQHIFEKARRLKRST